MNQRIKKLAATYYRKGNLIPLIGAGCSMPFGSPGWDELISEIAIESIDNAGLIEAVNHYIKKHDYWNAIKSIKDFGQLNEDDIKKETADRISRIVFDKSKDNNLKDLALMDFNIYLTTNYDHFLNHYMPPNSSIPICLSDFDFNSQTLYNQGTKRIFHLHGHISNPGTIVISEQSYNELYHHDKYKKMFNLLGASKAFLFIGMSFDDQFMSALLKDHVNIFKSKSFILLDKSQSDKFNELKENNNIEVIEYDSSTSGHTIAIRQILQEIASIQDNSIEPSEPNLEVIGAQLDKEKLGIVEENLFYKKLKLENIENLTLELCKLYFIAAEEYVASLKKHVVSKDVLGKILFIVFTKHKELFISEYQSNQSSQSFVNKVHAVLKEINFSRYMTKLESGQEIYDFEQQGLIHILADDAKEDVWWGNKRINGDGIDV